MRFSQRAFLYNRADFDFGEKDLHVFIDDGRLKIGFTAAYHEIGTKKSIKSFSEKAVMHSAIAVLMAVVMAYGTTGGDVSLSGGLVFFVFAGIGLTLCIVSGYMKFDATRLPVVSGNTILIFHDDQHQLILNEIYRRRTSEMLRLHGEVDVLNLPQLELKKFRWLREEGVISEQEFEEARLKIAVQPKTPPRPA